MIATVRWNHIQLAGRPLRPAGRLLLTPGVEAEMMALFQQIQHQCFALAGAT